MSNAWKVVFTIKDRKQKTGFMIFYVLKYDPIELLFNSWSDAELVAIDIAGWIDNMITGAIVNISISSEVDLPGSLKSTIGVTADIEEKAIFIFETPYSKPRVTVPTIKESLIVDFSDLIDTSDADVANFIFKMIDDGTGASSKFVRTSDSRGIEIQGLITAYSKFKKSVK